MVDTSEYLLRTIAEVLFCKQHTFATKDIFNHINRKKYEENISKVTQFVLKEMFCENTGSHFLDSGGAYGRGYDRANAIKHLDWMEQKHATAVVDKYSHGYSFYVSKNAYRFLCEQLEYDLDMDQRFHKFCQSEGEYKLVYQNKYSKKRIKYFRPKKESYYSCMSAWKDWLSQADYLVEDYEDLKGYNTYNGESCLNKTLQWEMFAIHNGKYEGHYIILQIHNGCDVRGGYSTPHIFKFDEDEFWCYMEDITCRCPNHEYGGEKSPGVQLNLTGKKSKDPVVDLDHVDCYSDDSGNHFYSNCGENIDNGSEFFTDEDGEHHIICKKCGAELEFW